MSNSKRPKSSAEKWKNPELGKARLNFSSILREETSVTFLERFTQRLTNLLVKTYGEKETNRIIDFIKKGKITIGSPETFLFKYAPLNDNSISLYNSSYDLDDFFFNALATFRKRAEEGETDIILREFFLVLIDIFSKDNKLPKDKLIFYVRYTILSLSNITHPSPFTIQLLHPKMIDSIKDYIGLELQDYNNLYILLFAHLKELTQHNALTKKEAYFPKMEIVYPVHKDVRRAQGRYLSSLFKIKIDALKPHIKNLVSLSEKTPELEMMLENLSQKAGYKNFDIETARLELARIEKEEPLITYPFARELYKGVNAFDKYLSVFKDKRIRKTYIATENYKKTFEPYGTNIIVNCTKESRARIEEYLDAAKNLALVRDYSLRGFKENNIKNKVIKTAHKITLTGVTEITKEFLHFIRLKISQIKSVSNSNFIYEIKFDPDVAKKHYKDIKSGYIRVISDIHADINKERNYSFNFGNDFVINCGDTAGDALTSREWNKTHIQKGVVIVGNHLGYSPSHPELNSMKYVESNYEMYGHSTHVKNTKNEQIYEMGVLLTGENGPRIMSNSETEYEGIKILGTTLYTDFALYGENHIEESMEIAKKGMNDFKYITVIGHREYKQNKDGTWEKLLKSRSNSQIRLFTPQDHAYYFNFSLAFLKEKVLEYKNKPIIIATHYAPSPYSISPQYAGNPLNPAFASNLNQFILENPNIRLWCHGHCIDDKTEVLTKTGWKTYKEINQKDIILNLNTYTNKIEEDRINAIVSKNYTGDVYHFQSKGSDIRVTDEHDMLTIHRKTKKITKVKAKDLYNKKQKFLIRAALQDKGGISLSDNLLRLLVWISADGNKPHKTTNLIRFRLYKQRKINRLEALLNDLKISYRKYQYENANGCSINFELPLELQEYSFKPIDFRITSCNRHQCKILLEEYANTDGVHNSNTIIIFTSKKSEADNIQLMCITNRYSCSITERTNHGFKLKSGKDKVCYTLNISEKPYRCIDNPHKTTKVEFVNNEHFWCLNTNNGTLIIRRNGKVNITGNCHSSFDYILGETRVVCEPFGYFNENNMERYLPSNYGKRILIKDIKSRRSWRKICASSIKCGRIKCYDN